MARDVDEGVLEKIADAFKADGYEGASLTKLTEATGLIKASLYHRFPGGKEAMAEAVLTLTEEQFGSYVLAPINEAGLVSERLAEVVSRLREFYKGGKRSCLLETLSVGEGRPGLAEHLRQMFHGWTRAFAQVARENGMSEAAARRAAEDAIAAIEGSLVLCRVSGSTKPFERALASLSGRLGGGD